MEIPFTVPLDSDGFLRRQCPHCEAVFKWHHGPAVEEGESAAQPASYYCPICGEPAGIGDFWTNEQVEYMRGVALPKIGREMHGLIADAFKGHNSSNFRVTMRQSDDGPGEPDALVEPEDDMVIIASPCHSYEPVKVQPDNAAPLHCLVCGAAFAV